MSKVWLNWCGVAAGCAFFLPAQAYKVTAAQDAAANNASCKQVASGSGNGFYWEIGDANGAIVHGTQGSSPPAPDLPLYVDSASKWIFGAYVLEKRGGLGGLLPGDNGGYTNSDVAYLQMGNGYDYINNLSCNSSDTIGSCYGKGSNSTQKSSDIGKFYYSGGNYLAMANNSLGLATQDIAGLADEVQSYLSGVSLSFVSPNPAVSVQIDSNNYTLFLRKILGNTLLMHDALSADAWCTNPATWGGLLGTKYKYCPTQSSTPPLPDKISFEYGLGHWIETDPNAVAVGNTPADGGVTGDGAFSSPGSSGFYPWIDAGITYYGIVAPADAEALIPVNLVAYEKTVLCGQAIRQAFMGQ